MPYNPKSRQNLGKPVTKAGRKNFSLTQETIGWLSRQDIASNASNAVDTLVERRIRIEELAAWLQKLGVTQLTVLTPGKRCRYEWVCLDSPQRSDFWTSNAAKILADPLASEVISETDKTQRFLRSNTMQDYEFEFWPSELRKFKFQVSVSYGTDSQTGDTYMRLTSPPHGFCCRDYQIQNNLTSNLDSRVDPDSLELNARRIIDGKEVIDVYYKTCQETGGEPCIPTETPKIEEMDVLKITAGNLEVARKGRLIAAASIRVGTSEMVEWAEERGWGESHISSLLRSVAENRPRAFTWWPSVTAYREYQQKRELVKLETDMVSIPGGSFLMESPEDEEGREDTEGPQHEVTVAPFFIGKYPVTQAQWRTVAALPQIERELDLNPSEFPRDNHPVETVSWLDAVEFCARLSQATGHEYRLPSEAEWEYACRAGTTTPFHFGETITSELANYDGRSAYGQGPAGEWRQETTPVGSFPANAFGLYDMHGNVWEWCSDHYEKLSPLSSSDSHGLRGGSWVDIPTSCRAASRGRQDSGVATYFIGFRVACSA